MAATRINPRLLRYALDPPAVMRDLGLDPDPWQVALLTSKAGRIQVLSTRQAGKSTGASSLALQIALTVPRALVVLVSPSQDQSDELFKKLADAYETLGRPVRAKKQNQSELELVNRARVLSLPSNPRTIRGYSKAHTIICDEAAMMIDEMFTSVSPMRAVSKGRLILITTPKGQRGYFWEQWESGSPDWERYTIAADQCPRITPEYLEGERRTMREAEWLQEYFCRFVQADDQYFSTESINRAFEDAPPPLFDAPL